MNMEMERLKEQNEVLVKRVVYLEKLNADITETNLELLKDNVLMAKSLITMDKELSNVFNEIQKLVDIPDTK